MKYKFLYRDENSIKFNGEILKIYLPKSNFETKASDDFISEYQGNFIKTMGIFIFEVTTFDNEQNKKPGIFYTLKLPINISFQYDDVYTEKRKLKDNLQEDIYSVFILKKDDVFINSVVIEKNIKNCKDFIFMLHKGNLPSILPYSEIISLYLETLDINDKDLGNTSLAYEMIISELCRYKTDMNIAFRKAINRKNVSEFDYKNINMKSLPMLSSVYGALSFEDLNQSIISSINRSIDNKSEVESPIEKTIKY